MKITPHVEEQLSEFISRIKLSDATKQLWYQLLRKLNSTDILELHSALLEKPELIFELSENLNKKINAIRNADTLAMDQIIDQEVELIGNL
jgi:hypothetical protein